MKQTLKTILLLSHIFISANMYLLLCYFHVFFHVSLSLRFCVHCANEGADVQSVVDHLFTEILYENMASDRKRDKNDSSGAEAETLWPFLVQSCTVPVQSPHQVLSKSKRCTWYWETARASLMGRISHRLICLKFSLGLNKKQGPYLGRSSDRYRC